MSCSPEIVIYQFSRSKVERGDFRHFLSLYGLEQLPTGRKLRQMMGAFEFCVAGYDDDPREIHSIPEVRRFYAAFHDAWPYWLYFCNLESDTLKTMVLCCLPNLTAVKVDGRATVGVHFDPLELVRFIGRDFLPMNLICERGQMFERGIYDRSRAVFGYFGLPYDAEPPP